MPLRIRVIPSAEREIREAVEWWQANRPAAPSLLLQELARGFELVSIQPSIGLRAQDPALSGIRRLHLYRIRYFLYYRVEGDTVEILAFWHTSRGDEPII